MPGGLRTSVVQAAESLASQIGPGIRICVLGGTAFRGPDSEALTAGLAAELDAAFGEAAVFITGGMAGVQETFAKHCPNSRVFNLLQIGGSSGYGVGMDLEAGENLDERKKVFGQIGDIYITVEGGPGVAQEARDAFKRGAGIVPLMRTGGASEGQFGFPPEALKPPAFAEAAHWELLQRADVPVADSIAAAAHIVAGFASQGSPEAPAEVQQKAPQMVGALGPAWTRGEIERPAGQENMGTWTASVYTQEQQARLRVDKFGKPLASVVPDAIPQAEAASREIVPGEETVGMPGGLRTSVVQAAESLASQIGPGIRICVLGGTAFRGPDSEALTAGLAAELDAAFGEAAVFITGGMAGVQETFAKHCPNSRVFNLLQIGGSSGYGVGMDLEAGENLDERKKVFGQIGDIYITVEGGPGVAQEARDAFKRGAGIVPLMRTGGASEGQFGFPPEALKPPAFAEAAHWELLQRADVPVADSIAAAAHIVAGFASQGSPEAPAEVQQKAPQMVGALGPAWTRGEIERPAGQENMGTWTASVYTQEQQARLRVDKFGKPLDSVVPDAIPEAAPASRELLPGEETVGMPGGLRMSVAHAAASLVSQIGPGIRICVLGGTAFRGPDSEALTAGLAAQLDAALSASAVFITGGMAGVQETFAKHCPNAKVFNLLQIGGSSGYGVGVDLEAGESLDERKKIFGQIGDIYITVEGGPGVAQEARDAFARGAGIVPLMRTGGASGGQFDFPAEALKPPAFAEAAWELLQRTDVPLEDSVAAAAHVVQSYASLYGTTPTLMKPGYITALLGSTQLLSALCTKYFNTFDADSNGVLELDEVTRLAQELYESLEAPPADASLIRESLSEWISSQGGDSLTLPQFAEWFEAVLRASLRAAAELDSSPCVEEPVEICLTAKSLNGQEVCISARRSDEVAQLHGAIAEALGLPPAQTRLAVSATGQLLAAEPGATVGDVGLASGCELSAVAVPTLVVRRHVYNARGGAPPYRGSFLTATDEVELDANVPFVAQEQLVFPSEGCQLFAIPRSPDGRAPNRWEDGLGVEVGLEASPAEVFGIWGQHEMVVLVPMDGMD